MESGFSLGGRKLVQVALTCRDLDRARSFYRDTLGLPLLFEAGNMLFFQLEEQHVAGFEQKRQAQCVAVEAARAVEIAAGERHLHQFAPSKAKATFHLDILLLC